MDLDPAFDQFVSRRSARLLRSAYLLTGDRAEAEDLLQVALLRTARRWESARSAPDAYAYRVLVNLVRDRHRRLTRRVIERPLDDRIDARHATGDHAASVGERDAMIGAVKRLPRRQREVVVLRFYADLSVFDTASALGTSPGSVKTHTSRALARLREVLTAEDPQLSIDHATEVPHAQ